MSVAVPDPAALGGVLELMLVGSPEELWRALVVSGAPYGGGQAREAVRLVEQLHRDRPEGAATTVLLVCTDWRWRASSGRLIAAFAASGLVADDELDVLARRLLFEDEVVHPAPARWFGERVLEVDLRTGRRALRRPARGSRRASVPVVRRVQPSVRRWAAGHLLRRDPAALPDVVRRLEALTGRHADAVLLGVFDTGLPVPAHLEGPHRARSQPAPRGPSAGAPPAGDRHPGDTPRAGAAEQPVLW